MPEKNLPHKICPVCLRTFSWRKKWERVWEEVKYCSKRCQGGRQSRGELELTDDLMEQIVRRVMEGRTPFDEIRAQLGLEEKQLIELMRSMLPPGRFKSWYSSQVKSKRPGGRKTKK
jgi:uncharacterized protein (TIGR03643 family)